MALMELFSRTVSIAQSKYKIVEKNVTQQSSYNLDLKLMDKLLEYKAIVEREENHYVLSDDYKLILGEGITKLINTVNYDPKVLFIYTQAKDGTKKFQIKRKENKDGDYAWFSNLYDKNIEGSKFKIYLDKDNKVIKFDSIIPVDVDTYDYELTDYDGNCDEDYLGRKLKEYYDELAPKPVGVHMFGIDYCSTLYLNTVLQRNIIKKAGINESYQRELTKGINIGILLKSRYTNRMPTVNTRQKNIGYNKIYYGIPGCGKSYKISQYLKNKNVDKRNIIRTTFFLDYSNSDFVGQIVPKIKDKDVTYEQIPGPFTQALLRAHQTEDMVYLVIEEINRGNAAAIFGDLFQLLDRKSESDMFGEKGSSEYPIYNEFIESYFEKNLDGYIRMPVYIPNNLCILATMNTSDQNIFPLDTAFKRRWDLEKVTDDNTQCEFDSYYIPYTDITWKKFRETVNRKITFVANDGTISEDKKLGKFFAKKDMFEDPETHIVSGENLTDEIKIKRKKSLDKFKYNILDYIYNDVCKFDKDGWFTPDISFDDICSLLDSYAEDQYEGTKNLGMEIFED